MSGASVATAAAGNSVTGGGFIAQTSSSEISLLQTLLYQAVLIQGLFSGMVAGVMGEGSPYAGLKHSIIMILVTYIAFSLFV
jgi:flagellar protein FlaJ